MTRLLVYDKIRDLEIDLRVKLSEVGECQGKTNIWRVLKDAEVVFLGRKETHPKRIMRVEEVQDCVQKQPHEYILLS